MVTLSIAQCIVCEVTLHNQKGYVVVTYQSPSQAITEFDEFLSNFDKLLNHIKQFRPSFTIILGDFNARSKSWWPDDVKSHEGKQIESLTTTHLRPNSFASQFVIMYQPYFYRPTKLSC